MSPPDRDPASRWLPSLIKRYGSINWALADQAMISGVNFATGILLARYLGIAEFGIFTLAWMIVEFVQAMQSSLLIAPMMSIGPKQSREERTHYLGSLFAQQTGFALISVALLFIGVQIAKTFFAEHRLDSLVWGLGAAVVFSQYQNFVRRLFFASGRSMLAFSIDLVRYAGQVVVFLWLFHAIRMDAGSGLWVIAATSLASLAVSAFFMETITWSSDNFRVTLVRHWAFSKWLLFSELMRWATGNFYIFVAGGMLGAAAVGAIRAAQNLIGMSHILMLGLENVVPAVAARRLSRDGKQAFLKYLTGTMIFGACVVGTIVTIASAAPEFWLELIYGKEYAPYGHLVVWWSVVYFLSFLAQQVNIGLRTIERTKSLFWASLVTAIISVVTVYPLIIHFGLVGVMIGLLMIVTVRLAMFAYSFLVHFRRLPA